MSGLVIAGGGGSRPPRVVRTHARGTMRRVLDAITPARARQNRADRAAWHNPHSGLGGIHDRSSYTTFEGGSPMSQGSVDALLEFNAIARRVVWREPQDATREGYKLKGNYTPEQLAAIETAANAEDLKILDAVARGRAFARATGGAGALMFARDGWETSQPLDFTRLEKLDRVEIVDRHDLTPVAWGNDPTRRRTWGKPILYQYNLQSGGPVSGSGLIHHSRVAIFRGFEVSGRTRALRSGWDGSVLDLIFTELANCLSSHQFTAEAVSLVTQAVFKLSGLGDAAIKGNADLIVDRLEAIQLSQGMFGAVAIDKDEEYSVIERSFTGLGALLDRLTAMLVAASEMPKTILMGEQPSGLNANGDSEITAWYDHVASQHDPFYSPPLLRLLEVLIRSRLGPTRGYWDPVTAIEWNPLYQRTDQEIAQTNLTNAQAAALMMSGGAISAEEARLAPWLVEAFPGFDPSAPPPPPPTPTASPLGEGDAFDGIEGVEPIIPADASEMIPGEDLVGTGTVANFLNTSRQTVINMAREQRFPAYRVGKRWRFQMSQVRKGVSASMAKTQDRGDQAPLPLG